MKSILIDSDVIIDVLTNRSPFAASSAIILARCQKGKLKGYITSISVSNIHYIVQKITSKNQSIEQLKDLMQFIEIAITDKTAVIEALHSSFNDFEDALQNFSGKAINSIQTVITRNAKDYSTSSLQILTPAEFLKLNP